MVQEVTVPEANRLTPRRVAGQDTHRDKAWGQG